MSDTTGKVIDYYLKVVSVSASLPADPIAAHSPTGTKTPPQYHGMLLS